MIPGTPESIFTPASLALAEEGVFFGGGSSANGDGFRFGGRNASSVPGGARGDSLPLSPARCVYHAFVLIHVFVCIQLLIMRSCTRRTDALILCRVMLCRAVSFLLMMLLLLLLAVVVIFRLLR